MRRIALLALAACGSHEDTVCPQLKAKLRPVIEGISKDATRIEKTLASFCDEPKAPDEKQLRACVLAATGTAATEACLADAFDQLGDFRGKLAGKYMHAHAESDAVGLIDAGAPIALASVPTLPVTDQTPGVETEVIAVDMPVDTVASALWGWEALLSRASGKSVRGRLVAPSAKSAAIALFAAGGVTPAALPLEPGPGSRLSLHELDVTQANVFVTLASALKTNIVVAARALPPIDIVFSDRAAGAIVSALAAFDGLVETHADYMTYLLPKGVKLRELGALSAAQPVSLHATDTSARLVSAALSAVARVPHTCSTTPISLHLEDVPPEEAARAIEVASGAKLDDAACPLTDATTVDPTRLAAIAIAGNQRVATTTDGALVHRSDKIAIELPRPILGAPAKPPPLKTFAAWREQIVRTAAVMRLGAKWRAFFELRDGSYLLFDPDLGLGMPPGLALTPVAIDATGVRIADVTGRTHVISLAAKP